MALAGAARPVCAAVRTRRPAAHELLTSNLVEVTELDLSGSHGVHLLWLCSSMTSIELPKGLTSLGEGAFCNCSSLTSIALPAGMTSLGEGAFNGCSSMASIALPAGLTSIGVR